MFARKVLPPDICVVQSITLFHCVLRCQHVRENVPDTLSKIAAPVMHNLLLLLLFFFTQYLSPPEMYFAVDVPSHPHQDWKLYASSHDISPAVTSA